MRYRIGIITLDFGPSKASLSLATSTTISFYLLTLLNIHKMTAKQQAVQDIKEELERQHKSFIPFIKRLTPVINQLVTNYNNKRTTIY